MVGSAALIVFGQRKVANFVGQWVPTILITGLYTQVVKVATHREHRRHNDSFDTPLETRIDQQPFLRQHGTRPGVNLARIFRPVFTLHDISLRNQRGDGSEFRRYNQGRQRA